ncbi:hypothetical protein I4U23_017637 [Adineta vaga]|nr:hypothetical protein I4U23_017637 [Adineta vaga]
MTTFLISILAELGVVIIIIVFGLLLAYRFIKRPEQIKSYTNILFDQSQGIVIDIDVLPVDQQELSITVVSNDVIDRTSHQDQYLKKKPLSISDSMHPHQQLASMNKTESNIILSDTSTINPLVDKITLEY